LGWLSTCKDCLALPFSHMANLTPCSSTLRYIVPVASGGPILSQYVLVLATMQTPCSHLLRVARECIVYSLHCSFPNVQQSLRHGMQLICLNDLESEAPVLILYQGFGGQVCVFWAPPSRDFWSNFLVLVLKGLKENRLSAVTGLGVDRTYIPLSIDIVSY